MKFSTAPFLFLAVSFAVSAEGETNSRSLNTVVLDDTGVKNLRIETVMVEETDFEETIFSLGRIESIPGKSAAVTSRVPGRVAELMAKPGDEVVSGAEVARVESRQPGNPPPTISLQAPIGGLVTQVEVRPGDPVEPDKALLEITDMSEVYAVARVPEHDAGRIPDGATAHVTVSALPGEKLEGRLLRFGVSADAASGTIDAIFALPNPKGRLRPEMRAEFSIVLSKRAGVVSVPRSALQGDAAGRFVYVKDFDLPNAFIKSPVVTGEINDRFVEITSGLLPADEVVTRGAYSLAFAGGGSLSLKEALDAAHGHEHNEDGSEIAKQTPGKTGGTTDVSPAPEGPFWKMTSLLLFLMLMVSLARKPKARGEVRPC